MKIIFLLCVLSVMFLSTPAVDIQASTDQFVLGVYRFMEDGGTNADKWYTDLSLFNPNDEAANVTITYLQKSGDSANSKLAGFTGIYDLGEELGATARTNALSANVVLEAGESQELLDIMKNLFGRESAEGAFQIISNVGIVAYGILRNQPTSSWGATLAIQVMSGMSKTSALTSSRIVGIKFLFLEYLSVIFLVNPNDEPTNVTISAKNGSDRDEDASIMANIVLSPGEVRHVFYGASWGDNIQVLFNSELPILVAADVLNFSDDLYFLEMVTYPKCLLQKFDGEISPK